MRVQVAIIGGGAAGLLLGGLLENNGIETVLLETRSREEVLGRILGGVLEQGMIDVLDRAGAGARVRREGIVHDGVELVFEGERQRLDLRGLAGRGVTVYEHAEVTRDLMQARDACDAATIYEAHHLALHGFDTDTPRVTYRHQGVTREIVCDVIVGCDGWHGASRASVPPAAMPVFERVYPFSWLGLLVGQPAVAEEAILVHHPRGFAAGSMRSGGRARYYLQVGNEEKIADWSDDRFWGELRRRLDPATAGRLRTGPSLEKSIAPVRSAISQSLRFGRLFLAGDAAHLVPPTGGKAINLAAGDVACLAEALTEFLVEKSSAGIDHYSRRAVWRAGKVMRFAGWMTSFLHAFPDADRFQRRMQRAEFDMLIGSRSSARAMAEGYTGAAFGTAGASG